LGVETGAMRFLIQDLRERYALRASVKERIHMRWVVFPYGFRHVRDWDKIDRYMAVTWVIALYILLLMP
jgi:hypothetical protein